MSTSYRPIPGRRPLQLTDPDRHPECVCKNMRACVRDHIRIDTRRARISLPTAAEIAEIDRTGTPRHVLRRQVDEARRSRRAGTRWMGPTKCPPAAKLPPSRPPAESTARVLYVSGAMSPNTSPAGLAQSPAPSSISLIENLGHGKNAPQIRSAPLFAKRRRNTNLQISARAEGHTSTGDACTDHPAAVARTFRCFPRGDGGGKID